MMKKKTGRWLNWKKQSEIINNQIMNIFNLKQWFFLLLFCPVLISSGQVSRQQEIEVPAIKTRILFIFDCSYSMYGQWQSDSKIVIANRLIGEMLDSLENIPNLELALRIFGHQKNYPPQDCDDTKLEIPFAPGNAKKIKQKLKATSPKGTTPIAMSLEKAADDFPPCDKCRNVIILITDGIEECNGDPCAVSLALQKKGIVLKPFIIGIGKNFEEAFHCVGTYFDGSSEQGFKNALNVVISQVLDNTTLQVNLLDIFGKPTETNVNMTFYDSISKTPKFHYIHTINVEGNSDTLVIDPLPAYYIRVNTIPPVYSDTFRLTPGKHTIVAVSTPQGNLEVKMQTAFITSTKYQFIVRQQGKMETINVQYFDMKEKYLVGNYDLEVLTMPRLRVDNIRIDQSTTTTIEIPAPGTLHIQYPSSGFGSLYVMRGNEPELFYNLNTTSNQEMLNLLPGRYLAVFRAKFHNRSFYTQERYFTIESLKTTRLNLSTR
jgi:Ca-activated chloride channel homolog